MRTSAHLCPFVPFLSRPAARWGRAAGDRRLAGRFFPWLWPLAHSAKRGRRAGQRVKLALQLII